MWLNYLTRTNETRPPHMDENYATHVRHVTHEIWMHHTCKCASYHTWNMNASHIHEMRHTYDWALAHVQMRLVLRVWFLRVWFIGGGRVLFVRVRGVTGYCGVATISRLLKIIGLFCKRALSKRRYSAKETYNCEESTNRSHPMSTSVDSIVVD